MVLFNENVFYILLLKAIIENEIITEFIDLVDCKFLARMVINYGLVSTNFIHCDLSRRSLIKHL